MLSTAPLAIAVAGVVGLPPVSVTCGWMKPKPFSATAMLDRTPSEIVASRCAGVVGVMPGESTVTVGAAA